MTLVGTPVENSVGGCHEYVYGGGGWTLCARKLSFSLRQYPPLSRARYSVHVSPEDYPVDYRRPQLFDDYITRFAAV